MYAKPDIRDLHRKFLICFSILLVFSLSPTTICAQTNYRIVHVFVALADNQYQGIIPVPARLGNGDDPNQNLYWGAAYGVRTYFKSNPDWQFVSCSSRPKEAILERCVYKYRSANVFLVADGYRGREIRAALQDFLQAAAGISHEIAAAKLKAGEEVQLPIAGDSDLIAYIGHDAFMDFQVPAVVAAKGNKSRPAIVLACASKQYFSSYLKSVNAAPLLWTTNLMAPEAYTLKAALDGWIAGESAEQIRQRAAEAYSKYQKCSVLAARKLLISGW